MEKNIIQNFKIANSETSSPKDGSWSHGISRNIETEKFWLLIWLNLNKSMKYSYPQRFSNVGLGGHSLEIWRTGKSRGIFEDFWIVREFHYSNEKECNIYERIPYSFTSIQKKISCLEVWKKQGKVRENDREEKMDTLVGQIWAIKTLPIKYISWKFLTWFLIWYRPAPCRPLFWFEFDEISQDNDCK